jgi:ElaB/YqjD/DUF883 family membrane-anchored ribosome-binding protein
MADKNSRVGNEKIGRPADDQVTGRAATERATTSTPASEVAGRMTGTTPGGRAASAGTSNRRTPAGATRSETDTDDRARELRAEIEATREDMSETVNEIQDRLRPSTIAANATESMREAAAERTRDFVESEPVRYVRANPIPTAMIGVGLAGLAWMAFGGRDAGEIRRPRYARLHTDWDDADDYEWSRRNRPAAERYGYGNYGERGRLSSPGSAAGGMGSDLTNRAGEMADDVRRRAESAGRSARLRARRAQTTLQRTWNENPLVIGAAATVLGALIGMAVPETEVENEYLGPRREQMVEGVQEAVREKVDEVQRAATKAADQVKAAVGITDDDSAKG